MDKTHYKPLYSNSRALVIGINKYHDFPELEFAKNDAEEISNLLINKFGFPKENMTLLLDDDATRQNILDTYLEYSNSSLPDDRILVYFAGHGHTIEGRRKDVGYLVPVEAPVDRLSSLISWDQFIYNSDAIQAKHLLFIMDACYGGLILNRNVPFGSNRFLTNMLQRYSRQALTAGKADEPVADSGGPIPGHSIFTGHLINALTGDAISGKGLITANGIMSYVHNQVGMDNYSRQTPHFGYIEGNGDFIFTNPNSYDAIGEDETGNSTMIEIPSSSPELEKPIDSIKDSILQYLGDRNHIQLDALVNGQIRKFLAETNESQVPVTDIPLNEETLTQRLRLYESITAELQTTMILLCYYGDDSFRPIIRKIIQRVIEAPAKVNGLQSWLTLRYYPSILLLYSGGISAIAAQKFISLADLLLSPVQDVTIIHGDDKGIIPVVISMRDMARMNIFQRIPGHEKHYCPRSEYLYKSLQPYIDDLLLLGKGYNIHFDHFEILLALQTADLFEQNKNHIWGPIGRFGWKHTSRVYDSSPYKDLLKDAIPQADKWLPIQAGLFNSSFERFVQIASKFQEKLDKLPYY